jgi:hypothetical protein
MDIQAEKLGLIKWLTDIDEPAVLQKLIALKNDQQSDWWDLIDDEERAEIEEGLAEADRGEGISHQEFIAKYDKWRSK